MDQSDVLSTYRAPWILVPTKVPGPAFPACPTPPAAAATHTTHTTHTHISHLSGRYMNYLLRVSGVLSSPLHAVIGTGGPAHVAEDDVSVLRGACVRHQDAHVRLHAHQ
eukprot:5762552-Pyramimonas_sp.AAC.1